MEVDQDSQSKELMSSQAIYEITCESVPIIWLWLLKWCYINIHSFIYYYSEANLFSVFSVLFSASLHLVSESVSEWVICFVLSLVKYTLAGGLLSITIRWSRWGLLLLNVAFQRRRPHWDWVPWVGDLQCSMWLTMQWTPPPPELSLCRGQRVWHLLQL